ncbi:type III-B CRISPR module RAMP protein Cmr6 [Anaerovorax odorimutans]|uniref:type III-B CRISPR module RAMP protein Cmr6 n=1 Tax=Anaerovorax odorimutans TaxID=109327 RepID=UPI0004199B4E|nr:type III-B CRISPR module RAMP protein Cmr6 [Anaerovorax odorimutans]
MSEKLHIKRVEKSEKNIVYCEGNIKVKAITDLELNKDDIAFIKEDNKGERTLQKEYIYKDLRDYLYQDTKNKKQISNISLKLNKFSNIFNLDKSYTQCQLDLYKRINKNIRCICKSLENTFKLVKITAPVANKLVIGLGGHSVFENDITLHHTYGVPYIPGQAIKGMFRNYILQNHCKYDEKGKIIDNYEKKAIKTAWFYSIFGGEKGEGKSIAGKVIFMDSFPAGKFNIKRDVIACHHQDYYTSGNKVPLDSDKVNPIKFLVLEKYKDDNENKEKNNNKLNSKKEKIKFKINIAIKKELLSSGTEKNSEEFIVGELIDALNYHGIGAKTSVGYGYFDIDKEKFLDKLKKENEIKLAEEKKKEEERIFKEETKNMSELEIELYKIDKIEDTETKNNDLMKLFKEK